MANHTSQTWFPEPVSEDTEHARRGESTISWLARSTDAKAIASRKFLNDNLARLPAPERDRFAHNLNRRWGSAFFELVVCRLMQELGAAVAHEAETQSGTRPDFRVEFPEGAVVVEATSPAFDSSLGDELSHHTPLLNHIEQHVPKGWSAGVSQLPRIGPNDSKREFKRVVKELLDVSPPSSSDAQLDLVAELSTGTIRIVLLPHICDELMWEAVAGCCDATPDRIRRALARKRRQVRNAGVPVLLAVRASGIASSLEHFSVALFGSTVVRLDANGHEAGTFFSPDGEFFSDGDGPPTYAGVLAFLYVGLNGCRGPVLFHNPRFAGNLPEPFQRLDQRRYKDACPWVAETPGESAKLVDKLGFVSM